MSRTVLSVALALGAGVVAFGAPLYSSREPESFACVMIS